MSYRSHGQARSYRPMAGVLDFVVKGVASGAAAAAGASTLTEAQKRAAAASASSGGSSLSIFEKMNLLTKSQVKTISTPEGPVTSYSPASSAGMSTTTKVALGGGAALALVLLLRRRKSA